MELNPLWRRVAGRGSGGGGQSTRRAMCLIRLVAEARHCCAPRSGFRVLWRAAAIRVFVGLKGGEGRGGARWDETWDGGRRALQGRHGGPSGLAGRGGEGQGRRGCEDRGHGAQARARGRRPIGAR